LIFDHMPGTWVEVREKVNPRVHRRRVRRPERRFLDDYRACKEWWSVSGVALGSRSNDPKKAGRRERARFARFS
jgi:hypothetical protein